MLKKKINSNIFFIVFKLVPDVIVFVSSETSYCEVICSVRSQFTVAMHNNWLHCGFDVNDKIQCNNNIDEKYLLKQL